MNGTGTSPADGGGCPCGSGERYGACCGPLHRGERSAQTAESLMRSRYAAFALRDTEYLRTTWHPSTRPDPLDLDADVRWRRLDILGTTAGGRTDATGEVEFRAFWSTPPAPGRRRSGGVLHERSRFRRESDRWYYVDGDILD